MPKKIITVCALMFALAPFANAQTPTRAIKAQIVDPCAADKKSSACRNLQRQKISEIKQRVRGFTPEYYAARAGDPGMSDQTFPNLTMKRGVLTAPRSVEPTVRGNTSTLKAAPVRTSPQRAPVRTSPKSSLPAANELASGGPKFDVDAFAQNIRDDLDGNSAGYAFAISVGGNLARQGAAGKLRKQGEGNVNQSPTRRQNIASISKMITAVAVLQLMDELNLTLDDKIAPYLPESWELGPNVENLDFEHLLRHRTGFTSTNSDFWNTLDWNGLSTMVENGAQPGAPFNYLNANFALFRFIIPAMWAETNTQYAPYTENGTAAAFWYLFYMQENIFNKIGVNAAQCQDPVEANEARYYDAATNLTGVDAGDWNIICGSGGWVLSANDLVNFMANTLYNDDILSPEMRDLMMDNRLGVYRTAGDRGDYFSHSGVIGWTGGQGMVMCLMRFNIAVEAAVLVNSPVTGVPGNQFCNTVLADNFDNAWD